MTAAPSQPSDSLTTARLRSLGLAFRQARVLLAGVELGLFGLLARGPLDAASISQQLGLHPRGVPDFLDTLVALGILQRQDGRYGNTPEADRFLVPGGPTYFGGGLRAEMYADWAHLTDALRTGQPQRQESTIDGERWTERYATLDGVRKQASQYTALSHARILALAQHFPWDRYHTLMDIGTSAGNLPVQVALAHPHITGGGFDLPPLAPIFAEYVAGFGLADRLRFVAGDFFADPLPSADVLTMSGVLHDWSLEERRLLLSKALAALPAGGTLVVLEFFIDDERRTNVEALLTSLQMLLSNAGGANFTGADCCRWMREAGFAEAQMLDLGGGFAAAIARKAS